MNEQNSTVMSKVERYYEDYGLRARELKKEGKAVIAYLCSLVPMEIITAAGLVPFRIRGNVNEPITKGDTNLETIACPFIRSCFDLSVKGWYDFCDGIVIPHGCDSMTRTYSTWRYTLGLSYQKEIADSDLTEAIDLYNENRDKAKALYDLRKSDPPLISGTEMSKILTVGLSLPVTESNELFAEVLEELTQRKESPVHKAPRIMVDGACIDNINFFKLIEDSGANVVVDSLCIGTRDYLPHTDVGGDPLDALARRYLDKINCPRTYREKAEGAYEKDLAARFGDIGSLGKEFKVDGVILYVYKYCDPFGFEVPARKAYLDSLNIPVLYLEDEYSAGTIGRLRTRIQAFLEVIE